MLRQDMKHIFREPTPNHICGILLVLASSFCAIGNRSAAGASNPPIQKDSVMHQRDDALYFTIYRDGVHFRAPVRERERFLRERAFLDDLVAPNIGRHRQERPVPDRTTDFYMLDDDELDAYLDFRRQLDAEMNRKSE